ncbi:MAG: hypothetical protein WA147_15405 [Polaromonas sp.]
MLLMHLYRRLERLGLMQDGSVAFPLNQQHIADTLAAVAAQPQGAAAAGRLLRRAAAQDAAFIACRVPLPAPDNPSASRSAAGAARATGRTPPSI